MELPSNIGRFQEGWEYFLDGRLQEAFDYFERQLEEKPDDHEARYWLAFISMTEGDLSGAQAEAERLTKEKPDWWGGWVLRAKVLVRGKSANLAVEFSDKAVELAPNEADVWAQRCEMFEQLKLWRDALFASQCAVDADGTRADAWAKMGVATAALGRWEEAHEYVKKAVELRPAVEHYRKLLDRSEGDLVMLASARRETPSNAAGWIKKGDLLPDPEETLACFQKAVELEPASARAWYVLAHQCLSMRRFEAGGAAVSRLKELSRPDFEKLAEFLLNFGFDEEGRPPRGVTAKAAGEAADLTLDAFELLDVEVPGDRSWAPPPGHPFWERVWKNCNQALVLNPACRNALWTLADIASSRKDEVHEAARRCHALHPGFWNVKIIVRRLLQLGKMDEALECARPYAAEKTSWEEEAAFYEDISAAYAQFLRRLLGGS